LFILLVCAMACSRPAWAGSSEISDRLDRIAKSLSSAYQAKRPGAGKESIAVFPFNSNAKLAKERVGFAISELLTHHFTTMPAFTTVERGELSRIMEE